MTEPRDDSPNDPHFSRWYRQYATDAPSNAVDQQILTAARAALANRPEGVRQGRWWQRWRTPVALAATLLLTLALLQQRQPGELPVESALRQELKRGDAPSAATSAAAKSVAASAPAKPEAVAAPSTRAVENSGTAVSPVVAGSRASAEKAAVQDSTATAGNLPARAPAAAKLDGVTAGGTARFESAAVPAASPALTKAPAEGVRPVAWLEEIRALRRDGRFQEAERQLREFRRVNPDYPLPEEFRQ